MTSMKPIYPVLLSALLFAACDPPKATEDVSKEEAAVPEKVAAEPIDAKLALLKFTPTEAFVDEELTFRPADGHHFELKAPQKCGEFAFRTKSAKVMRCQLGAPGDHKFKLSICDDGKAYCKQAEFVVTTTAPKGWVASGQTRPVMQPPKAKEPVEGFIMNDPKAAVELAKKDDALLMIHFYGIWCPPCNLLEENVYGQPEFKEKTGKMVRLMLDADSDVSWELKSKFKIGGYPTVVVANANLDEVDRVVGYRAPAAFSTWIDATVAQRQTPVSVLAKTHSDPKSAPEDARLRLGKWHHERGEYQEALTWLAGLKGEGRKVALKATQRLAKRQGESDQALATVVSLAHEFPEDIGFSGWVQELVASKPEVGKPLVEAAFKNIDRWEQSPKLAATGYGLSDLHWLRAGLYEATEDKEKAAESYLAAANAAKELAGTSNLKVARGANMERAYALFKAGKNDEAKKLYDELSDTYPEEFSFNYSYASLLLKLDEPDRAMEFALKALNNAYGDNALRAAHLKAKIELKQDKKSAALATIDGALAEAIVPASTAVRTHRYIANLRELKGQAQ